MDIRGSFREGTQQGHYSKEGKSGSLSDLSRVIPFIVYSKVNDIFLENIPSLVRIALPPQFKQLKQSGQALKEKHCSL